MPGESCVVSRISFRDIVCEGLFLNQAFFKDEGFQLVNSCFQQGKATKTLISLDNGEG